MKHLGDITKIYGNEAPVVDCVIGGSPCQDLSLAGKRAGLAGARSGLYMEQIRIIKEMREADVQRGKSDVDIRPRYMVWENVPGAFSTNKGKDFAAVIEEAIRVAEPEAPDVDVPEKGWPTSGCFYDEMGKWSVAWRVLDAQFWGTSDKPLPQRRRRIALVADFGGLSAPEILFVRKSVSGDIEPGKQERKEAPGDAGEGFGGSVPVTLKIRSGCEGGGKSGAHSYEGVSPTLTCTHGGEPAVVYGTIVPVLDDQGGSQISVRKDGKCPTLRAEAHGNLPCVMQPASFYPQMKAESQCFQNDGINNTLVNGTNPGFQNAIAEAKCYEMQAFGKYKDSGIASALKARDYKDATDLVVERPNEEPIVIGRAFFNVRRLTPLECERLQGFPDGWTDIGEWVDSKGKKHKEADSPRYKALGNSIAIPPWKWVLKRLCACYERDATMASLFDGIGGFPYIWEQLNGKGSCLWASEIEEFPMAVTRLRFGGQQWSD